jgi:putative sugar O-methyltransferase
MNGDILRRAMDRVGWSTLAKVGLTKKRIAQTLGRGRLTPAQVELLRLMRDQNSQSHSPFKASPIWLQLSKRFDDWFWWEGIADVESQRLNNFFSTPAPADPKLLRYAAWMFYRSLKQRDELDLLSRIPASVSTASGLAFDFDNDRISWDQLISIDTLYSMIEADRSILTDAVVVVDLGAGWGRMGYVLKKANPKCVYVVCDLPEALLVSSSYLPRILPEETFHSFTASQAVSRFDADTFRNGEIFFLGAEDLERIADKSVDFFINIGGFQEMTPVQVDQYFELIDAKVRGILFTQQLVRADTHNYQLGEITGYDEYPFRTHWKQLYLRQPTFSDLYFETAYRIP